MNILERIDIYFEEHREFFAKLDRWSRKSPVAWTIYAALTLNALREMIISWPLFVQFWINLVK